MIDHSPASRIVERLVKTFGRDTAHQMVDVIVAKFTNVELAALASDWSMWARSKQVPPATAWTSYGYLTGRGFGKTLANSHFVNEEIEAGRAMSVGLAAQDEANCVALQVLGPSGLIATAPPWFRPEWEASKLELVYPNGARVYVRTPEVPGKIRGFDYHLSWICELQSWPLATRVDAYEQFLLATRLGMRRIVWDCTPRRGHPILKELLANAVRDPERHVVVRGRTEECIHLANGYVEDLKARFGDTQKGREELLGEMIEDSDGALWRQAWLEKHRRPSPSSFVRKVVACDPAVTSRKGSDNTGIVTAALGGDGRAYVLKDDSGKLDVGRWADLVLDRYTKDGCDLVLAETNKGGDLVVQNLRAAAKDRGLAIVVIGKEERAPRALGGTVFVREVHARGAKEERAQPVATAYERGRVSHVLGADLAALEETLTTWEPSPGADSPGDMDALVHGVAELLALNVNAPDPSTAFKGIGAMSRALYGNTRGNGGRI